MKEALPLLRRFVSFHTSSWITVLPLALLGCGDTEMNAVGPGSNSNPGGVPGDPVITPRPDGSEVITVPSSNAAGSILGEVTGTQVPLGEGVCEEVGASTSCYGRFFPSAIMATETLNGHGTLVAWVDRTDVAERKVHIGRFNSENEFLGERAIQLAGLAPPAEAEADLPPSLGLEIIGFATGHGVYALMVSHDRGVSEIVRLDDDLDILSVTPDPYAHDAKNQWHTGGSAGTFSSHLVADAEGWFRFSTGGYDGHQTAYGQAYNPDGSGRGSRQIACGHPKGAVVSSNGTRAIGICGDGAKKNDLVWLGGPMLFEDPNDNHTDLFGDSNYDFGRPIGDTGGFWELIKTPLEAGAAPTTQLLFLSNDLAVDERRKFPIFTGTAAMYEGNLLLGWIRNRSLVLARMDVEGNLLAPPETLPAELAGNVWLQYGNGDVGWVKVVTSATGTNSLSVVRLRPREPGQRTNPGGDLRDLPGYASTQEEEELGPVNCTSYCDLMQANCTDANQQFPDAEACNETCEEWLADGLNLGNPTDRQNATLGCRWHYAYDAGEDGVGWAYHPEDACVWAATDPSAGVNQTCWVR